MNLIYAFRAKVILLALVGTMGLQAQVLVKNSSNDTTWIVLDNGNVGIGKVNPQEKLDVIGTIRATAFTGNGSALTGTGDNLGNHIAQQNLRLNNFWLSGDGGSEGIFINSDGEVGIGTNDPDTAMEVNKYLYLGGDGNVETGETVGTLGWYNNDANSPNIPIGGITMYNRNNWWDSNLDKMDAAMTFSVMENAAVSEAMRIDYNGKVGIGITVPAYLLEVDGTFQADNVRSGNFDLPTINGSPGQFLAYNGTWATPPDVVYSAGDDLDLTGTVFSLEDDININYLRAVSSSGLTLYDDGGNLGLIIKDGGNVGIGTTNPGFRLEVNGTFQADNVRSGTFNLPVANGATGQFLSYNGNWATPSGSDSDWGINGNDVYTGTGGIYPTGNVGIGLTSPSGSARLEISNMAAGVSGIKINSPGQSGLVVQSPTVNGAYVTSPGYYGFAVDSPTLGGFWVNNAGTYGLYINNSTLHGMYIQNSTNHGIRVASSDWWGIIVDTTGWAGICIKHSGTHGLDIYDAGEHGIQVTNAAYDGVHVSSASDNGIYAETNDGLGEWGVYTPDKIYGQNVTSKNMSIYGFNDGPSALEPGDVVSISANGPAYLDGPDRQPILKVTKAGPENAEALIGVVEYKVAIETRADKLADGTILNKERLSYAGEYVGRGDYLSIIVSGIADVKMNGREVVRVGQKLTVSDNNGAIRALTADDSWTSGFLGKALENSNGKGTVKVYVNCK